MAIDLKGFDPWPSIGGGVIGAIDAPSAVLGAAIPGTNWLSLGMSLLGGMGSSEMTQSGAAGGSAGGLNTSGWVVGKGDANGGSLSQSSAAPSVGFSLASVPWYGWVAGALVAVAMIKGGR